MKQQAKNQVFMYGSNLNSELLKSRVYGWDGHFKRAFIPNYQLRFNKLSKNWGVAANIVPHPTRKVWGILVVLDDRALIFMDKNECYLYPDGDKRNHYERKQVDIFLENGDRVNAYVYVAHHRRIVERLLPSSNYCTYVTEGAKNCGLPLDYINNAILIQALDK